jgi:hypothetical protein
VRAIWLQTSDVMGLQSGHSSPPSPEVEFTPQSQSRTPIRACSGWPQHSGGDSKILATAEAQAVRLFLSDVLGSLCTGLERDVSCFCQ